MLTRLRSFLVVVEEGSLRRAATRLHMSQPVLSRQMRALEDERGAFFFDAWQRGRTAGPLRVLLDSLSVAAKLE